MPRPLRAARHEGRGQAADQISLRTAGGECEAHAAGGFNDAGGDLDESRIVVNAHRINRGEMPEWPKRGEDSDFWFVDADDPEKGAAKVVEIVRDRIPRRF